MFRQFKIALLTLCIPLTLFSQEYDENGKTIFQGNRKGLNLGLYMGVYFANQFTADLYNGYGLDVDGVRNTFENSFMYNKIVLQYGGYYGQTDQIAEALKVNHDDWSFNESDMPTNMRYTPAFIVGLNVRYSVDAPNAILFNINATKLNITGNFTITTKPPTGSTQINNSVRTCAIKGTEQRLGIQLGYQHIFQATKNINFFAEAGLHMTMVKFDKNEILIGDLLIDLTDYYYQPGNNAFAVKKPVGVGFGAFGGAGANVNFNEDFRIQLVYQPTYEGIKLGERSGLRFQHSVALRIYYGL
jgi:hypothetical protein